jgi:hypothetical protein
VKHVIKIETGIRVVSEDDDTCKHAPARASDQSWEEIVQAIDERANYIGPVLDHLLHMEQDVRPWVSRL